MTQQDHTQKRSNSSGGGGGLRGRGRSSGKKPTSELKMPKRGPGIAQLEKIIIENEQRRKAAAISPPPPSLQLPDSHYSNQPSSSSSVPLQNSSGGMSMNFPYASNLPSNWTPRIQQYQQPSSSSMVNVPSGNLTPPVNYYSKEPPSNQNNSSSFVPMMVMPVDKMIILKSSRSYPFYRVVSPASSSAFREVPSGSTTPSSSSEPNSKKSENLNGHFLSLGPPIWSSKSKSTSTFPEAFHNQELPPPSQGIEEAYQIPHGQQHYLHNFLPPNEEAQCVQTIETNKDGNCNGENGESMDLDLKL